MKISVTLLSSYLYCSRKLFLEKVLKLEEPPKESLVMGTIRHEAYDYINKKEELIVSSIEKKIPLGEVQELYKKEYLKILRKVIVNNKLRLKEVNINMLDAYKKSFPFILEESSTRALNIFNFIEQNNVFGEVLWERLTPKIISELRVESDELRLKGIIDQVHVYDNDYVPFELKTGKMPFDGIWPSHRVQIAAYSMLLQERFNKDIKEGFVVYLDTKEKRHIAINPYMKEEVIQLVNEVIDLLESKELPDFCNNKNKCRKCGLREKCYSKGEMENLLKIRANRSETPIKQKHLNIT
ncbi:CRISPR-associated protein Cas4 [Candidatus Woesearchaeota archaeon]|nr:CRISPR-associated protein Cas4 [Candidatus Woesearchaeota archaeon]